jgi:hypothetical protein
MTYEKEENTMGWMLVALVVLTIVAITIAMQTTPTPSTQDAPCLHSH